MNEQAWFCRRQQLINICIMCWYICILILVPTASFWRSIMKREWKLSGVCRIQSRSKSNSIYYHYVFTNQNDDNPIQFMLVFHKGDRQLGIPSWGMMGNMEIMHAWPHCFTMCRKKLYLHLRKKKYWKEK